MTDSTLDQNAAPVHTCHGCTKTGPDVAVVGSVESTSGPGFTVWGCPTCAPSLRVLLDR